MFAGCGAGAAIGIAEELRAMSGFNDRNDGDLAFGDRLTLGNFHSFDHPIATACLRPIQGRVCRKRCLRTV